LALAGKASRPLIAGQSRQLAYGGAPWLDVPAGFPTR
jgi:hypothetical protein